MSSYSSRVLVMGKSNIFHLIHCKEKEESNIEKERRPQSWILCKYIIRETYHRQQNPWLISYWKMHGQSSFRHHHCHCNCLCHQYLLHQNLFTPVPMPFYTIPNPLQRHSDCHMTTATTYSQYRCCWRRWWRWWWWEIRDWPFPTFFLFPLN